MISNNKGFSLIEVITAVALATGISLLMGEIIRTTYSSFSVNKVRQDALLKEKTLENQILNFSTLEVSADLPSNANLKSCLLGTAKSGCTTNCCTANQEIDFYLIPPHSPIARESALAGTTQDPVRYDLDGIHGCTNNCQYKITAKYIAKCLGDLNSCEQAEFIKITLVSESIGNISMKKKSNEVIYYVENNQAPFFITIFSDISMNVASVTREIPVTASPGQATEQQHLIYEECLSSDTNIATVTCYGFKNGYSMIQIKPLTVGSINVTLRLNDAQAFDNLSDQKQFNVTITP